ncbi:hypothetical protein [Gluconobacter cerinus]|uniref:hypothetical protein n=1 Tax=Gluconobacter cerinus TaxID=38307 RepID=UPI002011D6CB|nr:hypothetical protein [Gluconobacter cerinus]
MEDSDFPPLHPKPELVWIWRAWHRLSSERSTETTGIMAPMGGSIIQSRPGYIPWTVTRAWAEHHELSVAEMALLDRCLVAMDDVFRAYWTRKQEDLARQ